MQKILKKTKTNILIETKNKAKEKKGESEEKQDVNNQDIYQTLSNNGIENACLLICGI